MLVMPGAFDLSWPRASQPGAADDHDARGLWPELAGSC